MISSLAHQASDINSERRERERLGKSIGPLILSGDQSD